MAVLPFGTKPLPSPEETYCQLNALEYTLVKINSKQIFLLKKMHFKSTGVLLHLTVDNYLLHVLTFHYLIFLVFKVNSLASGRGASTFKCIILKLIIQVSSTHCGLTPRWINLTNEKSTAPSHHHSQCWCHMGLPHPNKLIPRHLFNTKDNRGLTPQPFWCWNLHNPW